MSLLACWECGGMVGETAEVCPHCGSAQFEYHRITVDTVLKRSDPDSALREYIAENSTRKPKERDRYIGDGVGWEVVCVESIMRYGLFDRKGVRTLANPAALEGKQAYSVNE